jgi:intein/homing endonuclease
MAKLSSNDAQFIRNVFKRERQSAELAISNKDLARNSVGGGVFGSAIDSSVNGVMGDILSLDRRMLYRYRDYEEMDEYGDISCLSGDSLVFTLEWGWRRIDNLAEHGGQFYVLSYDIERRSIVPAKCDGTRMTGQRGHAKRMVRVVLDNGTSIRCTADHLFMLKDGGWTRADGLRFQDRVMSCVIGLGQSISKNTLLPESGNNRVVAVEQLDMTEDVYDLSVPEYRNFICNGVIVHNSALDIYSDDATQVDGVTGKSVWVETDDGKVKDELTDLFDKRLRIEEKIWEITRTLCKYGNDLEEIVVGDNGVVGLNYLAVPTMRRVENKRGDLIGFMQTYSRDTDISPEEFEKMRISTGGALGPQKDIAVFEDWRVAHMRLTSKYRDSLYGWAVTDAARWIWKRLMLLEDAVLVYKLCLRGDSEIWTESGYKKIADIEEGDVVYCYGRDDKLRKTEVVYKKYNGRDQIFKVSSRSRDLYANATHPVLVETILKNGRGKKRGRLVGYVEVKDIKPGEHRFMTPSISGDGEEIELKFPETIRVAKARRPITMVVGIRQLQNNCGVQSNIIKSFFSGERVINHDAAIRLLDENGTLDAELDVWEDWGGYRRCGIPPVVTEDFARLWGFMIGDGYVSKRLFKKNGREYFVREVGFAAGDKAEVNNEYKELFEEFFGKAAFVGDKRSKHDCVGNMSVSSKPAYEFMIMNGFIPGAHNKRLPEWVFRASGSVKHAFLQGLLDADGWTEDGGVSEERSRVRHGRMNIELCNEGLVHDVRNLVMQLGFRVSRVSVREREGGRAILDNGSPLLDRASYCLSWSFDRQPISEEIKSVDLVGEDDIWDIGVKAEEHNFVADGVVVHNTRSPSRYAFYVDIGKLGKAEGERALQETMQRLKKRKFVNPRTGKLDLRFSPLSMDEDFFLAMREGRESTRVESLMGPSYQQVDDVQYFLYKLYAALKVPRAYMGYDENMPSKATLSQEDVRFARTILRVQREVRNGLRKVAKVDLAARKIDPDAVDFDVKMTVPSSIFELGQMEVRRARADLASMMERHVSQYWLLKNIYGMSEDDIQELTKQRKDENKMANEMGGTGGGRYEDVIVPTGGRRGFVGYGRPGMISERELFDGNREHERQVEERIRKAINDPNSHVGKQLRETGHLLREILFTVRRVA